MKITQNIAKHLREVYCGNNWTCSNLKDNLHGVTLEMACKQIHSLNSILILVYHMHYYVQRVTAVLQGEKLNADDKLSFQSPPINSENEWTLFIEKVLKEGNQFADLIEKLPDSILEQNIADPKYGIYYRNLHGIIEHTHYHLGQIAIIKKLLSQ